MTHGAIKLQGKPWVVGMMGPDSFDCWGLVVYVQQQFFCRSLPMLVIADKTKKEVLGLIQQYAIFKEWVQVDKEPKDGDCVLLSHTGDPFHIGVCLRINRVVGVLHCVRNFGVVFSTFKELEGSGYLTKKLYRHVEQCQ